MTKGRLEAFSDGVVAILITIMVLELKVPKAVDWTGLHEFLEELPPYVLSFGFLGIYWNNHHHMLHLADRVNGRVLWANLHLLFWLSLIPFGTAWMKLGGSITAATYGAICLFSGIAYVVLQRAIISAQGEGSRLAAAIGRDAKGTASALLYAAAIPLAFVHPWISYGIYVFVALMWIVPDPRIEKRLK